MCVLLDRLINVNELSQSKLVSSPMLTSSKQRSLRADSLGKFCACTIEIQSNTLATFLCWCFKNWSRNGQKFTTPCHGSIVDLQFPFYFRLGTILDRTIIYYARRNEQTENRTGKEEHNIEVVAKRFLVSSSQYDMTKQYSSTYFNIQ